VRQDAIIALVKYGKHVDFPAKITVEEGGYPREQDFVNRRAVASDLVRILQDQGKREVWINAMVALGSLGADASSALPTLNNMLKERDATLVSAAQDAIDKIEAAGTSESGNVSTAPPE
jgi:hypothetical protein